jgi:hypothetical protein
LSPVHRARNFHRREIPISTRPMQVVRFWRTFADPVSRHDCLRHGAGLVATTHAGNAAPAWVSAC